MRMVHVLAWQAMRVHGSQHSCAVLRAKAMELTSSLLGSQKGLFVSSASFDCSVQKLAMCPCQGPKFSLPNLS